jgi:hypothetical protein
MKPKDAGATLRIDDLIGQVYQASVRLPVSWLLFPRIVPLTADTPAHFSIRVVKRRFKHLPPGRVCSSP